MVFCHTKTRVTNVINNQIWKQKSEVSILLLFTEAHLEKNVKRFKTGDHFTDGPFWTEDYEFSGW